MLVFEFFAIFAGLVAIEEAVEFDGSANGLVEAQIVVALFLRLFGFVAQHDCTYNYMGVARVGYKCW